MRHHYAAFLVLLTVACGSSQTAPSGYTFINGPDTTSPSSASKAPSTVSDPPVTSNTQDANQQSTNTQNSNTQNPNKPPTYTPAMLSADMNAVLQHRTAIYSNQGDLGNPANIALWDSTQIQKLYDALLVANATYYPAMQLADLAHMVLTLGAADSTGDLNLSGGSVGFLQVTTSTVEQDFISHGEPISGAHGIIVDPAGAITLTDPGENVVIWAWSTRNSVSSGESANEIAALQHNGHVVRDFGNALIAWLCGPNTDRHNLVAGSDAANRWPPFALRLQDYFVQAGFGDPTAFNALLNISVPSAVINFKGLPAGAFP